MHNIFFTGQRQMIKQDLPQTTLRWYGEWLAVRMLKTSCNFNDQQTLGEGTQPAAARLGRWVAPAPASGWCKDILKWTPKWSKHAYLQWWEHQSIKIISIIYIYNYTHIILYTLHLRDVYFIYNPFFLFIKLPK